MKTLFIFLVFGIAVNAATPTAFEIQCNNLANQKGLSSTKRLQKLFDLSWDYWMNESPESATAYGFKEG